MRGKKAEVDDLHDRNQHIAQQLSHLNLTLRSMTGFCPYVQFCNFDTIRLDGTLLASHPPTLGLVPRAVRHQSGPVLTKSVACQTQDDAHSASKV